MKRKILAILLAACAAFSLLTLPAAAEADTGVVQTVRAMGIIQGDLSGNLNLSSNVTRAQFAKMLVAASTYKDSVGEGIGSSLYKDVKSGYWASKYIKVAVEQGWMLGYTDGTFRPDRTITLEEACASVLRELGYDSSTMAGAYPYAQLSKADALGLRDQISLSQGGVMSRSDCANLFYNMMTAQNSKGQTYASSLGYTVTNGQVDYAALVTANLSGPFVCDGSTPSLPFGTSGIAVYRDGVTSTLTAMSQYDVYYYNTGLRTVWVYTDRAAGTVTAISPNTATPSSVTVGGNTYSIGTSSAAYKLSALGGFRVGDTALLLLGMDGSVVDVLSGSASSTVYYGVVLSTGTATASGSSSASVVTNVKVACTDGVVHTFSVSSGATYSVGTLVTANITDSGTTVKSLSDKTVSGSVNSAATQLGTLKFADNVQILDTTSDGGYAIIYPARLAGVTLSSSSVRYYALNENGQISDLILNNATGDIWSYCYMISAGISGSSDSLSFSGSYTYVMNGVQKTLNTSNVSYSVSAGGAAIQFSSDGASVKSMRNLNSAALSSVSSLYAMSGNQKYLLDDSVQVYLNKNGSYYTTTLSAVDTSSYTLTGWYDSFGCPAGGRIRVITAIAK